MWTAFPTKPPAFVLATLAGSFIGTVTRRAGPQSPDPLPSAISTLLNLGSNPETREQLFTNSVIGVISVDSEIIFFLSLSPGEAFKTL